MMTVNQANELKLKKMNGVMGYNFNSQYGILNVQHWVSHENSYCGSI